MPGSSCGTWVLLCMDEVDVVLDEHDKCFFPHIEQPITLSKNIFNITISPIYKIRRLTDIQQHAHNPFTLQSNQLKRSSDEQINEFIITDLISGIISTIWFSDE